MADSIVPDELYGRKINEAERMILERRANEQRAKEEATKEKLRQEQLQQEANFLAKKKADEDAARLRVVPLSDRRALFGEAAPQGVIKTRPPVGNSLTPSGDGGELHRSSSMGSLVSAQINVKPVSSSVFSAVAPRSTSATNVSVFASGTGNSVTPKSGSSNPIFTPGHSSASFTPARGAIIPGTAASSSSTPYVLSSSVSTSAVFSSSSTPKDRSSSNSSAGPFIPEVTITRAAPARNGNAPVAIEERPRSHSASGSEAKELFLGGGRGAVGVNKTVPTGPSTGGTTTFSFSAQNALTRSAALAKSDEVMSRAGSSNPTTPVLGRRDLLGGVDGGTGNKMQSKGSSSVGPGGGNSGGPPSSTSSSAPPTSAKGISDDICRVCARKVYKMEEVRVDSTGGSLLFHSWCFRCHECNGKLSLGSYAAIDGVVYCKPHFKQLFSLKGNYNEGFGTTQRKYDFVKDLPEDDSSV